MTKNKFQAKSLEEIFGEKKNKRTPLESHYAMVESIIQKEKLKMKVEALEKLLRRLEEKPESPREGKQAL